MGAKKSKGKKQKSLKERYEAYANRVKKDGKPLSFRQAQKYARLGQFLLKYPMFVFQLQFVTMNDWDRQFEGATLIDIVENVLNEEERKFWKGEKEVEQEAMEEEEVPMVPSGEEGEGEIAREHGEVPALEPMVNNHEEGEKEDVCIYCERTRERAELWNCSNCSISFHELCAGYADGTVCHDIVLQKSQDVELETLAYCRACLEKLNLTVDDVQKGIMEAKAIGQFLDSEGCPFTLQKMDQDGFCCFRILNMFVRSQAKGKNVAGTPGELCRKVAKAAIEFAKQLAKELGEAALESESIKGLRKLANAKGDKPVELLKGGLWEVLEVEHILNGFVNLCEGRVVVNVWQVVEDGSMRNTMVYGEAGEGTRELNMLQWNSIRHYDLLI